MPSDSLELDGAQKRESVPVDGLGVMKTDRGWFIGTPRNGTLYWERRELNDLLYLGIGRDYLESCLVNKIYWAQVTRELFASG